MIVTTRQDLPAAVLARRMFDRWRQENFFKYVSTVPPPAAGDLQPGYHAASNMEVSHGSSVDPVDSRAGVRGAQ
jgi:hypothetical protein